MAPDIIISSSITSTDEINSICLGSGRFLRSVLVPFLSSHSNTAVFQTRGRNFVDSFAIGTCDKEQGVHATLPTLEYLIDTKNCDGSTTTQSITICAAGTLGNSSAKSHFFQTVLAERAKSLEVIGVGVTEAGLQSRKNGTMVDLTTLLYRLYELGGVSESASSKNRRICVVNTDNVPNNGDLIRKHVLENARELYGNEVNVGDVKNGGDEENSGNGFVHFLEKKVAFLNTMVDRITSARPGSNGMIPLCEPLPMKALVICDEGRDLPKWMESEDVQKEFGVKIRHSAKELASDIVLKLRIANGTHTAVAHVMALSSLLNTDSLSNSPSSNRLLLTYLDTLFQTQILPASTIEGITPEEILATWQDWRQRLIHPHFGLSTFFITQNGAAKGGIRLGPTVKSLVRGSSCPRNKNPLNVSLAFAMAAILRFVTPIADCFSKSAIGQYPAISEKMQSGIYVGWLDDSLASGKSRDSIANSHSMESSAQDTVNYADGLRYNLSEGWYEFRCDCPIKWKSSPSAQSEVEVPLQELLSKLVRSGQPCSCGRVVRSYLLHPQGGDLGSLLDEDEKIAGFLDEFVCAVSTLYARMVSGDKGLDLLQEMTEEKHVYKNGLATSCIVLMDGVASTKQNDLQPLRYRLCPIPSSSNLMGSINNRKVNESDIRSIVFSEVSSAHVIDLHTHLLPPSHGALCLWGIDELLTYHYLVAEYFMTAPADVTPQGFYAMSKKDQADLIWDALFVKRSPISEATRGVITTLVGLGLDSHVKNCDLQAIREFYDSFRNDGLSGAERFCELVYQVSGVRYAVMTNIPFDSNESRHWRPKKKEYPDTFKSALRVDPLLAGDKETIETALKSAGYGTTLADARQYLHDWCDTMKPEYMMASTPHDFSLSPLEGRGTLAGVKKSGIDEKAMQSPFAFTDLTGNKDCEGCEETDDMPSVINESSNFLTQVLMPVCEERDLPLALKIGAHRGVNPELRTAGDGIVAFADTESLSRLCARFPKVRFLATFLSRVNQHEACVLANKWRNLHLYGCWWYCNNPSIIHEITSMRVEMLGTAFTSQHSDARVMDQLIYKWSHSRAVIADVLAKEYEKVLNSGWSFTRAEIRRDVRRLLGGSYEEFMKKSLT
mmetsp:Transcript_21128/g.41839  ORF Transcript_21128/g.41839 Transcript_21128/m.41839 type:complete len:1121 (+) Transcript_21128:71-3433(+)|eukprot:CAMPEP_0171327662 /NCGR_PEP_ID=MMETSP0878-20121228/161_1 /TAXON_ID=67004 /ORGANISM="Thalassiosira weissflogii, Strain CCMP1336" /LENGTH=1120 /DNA_ID=CAMNT_0011827449 /DNA_START=45 /DNA_END=3407 /DNA_ORIENTATION=+